MQTTLDRAAHVGNKDSFDPAAIKADADELGRLLDDHKRYLIRVARSFFPKSNNGRLSVEDCVQQTYCEACRSIDTFRGQTIEEFRGWISSILRRRTLKEVRRNSALKRSVNRESFHPCDSISLVVEESPLERMVTAEQVAETVDALDRLWPSEAESIRLQYFDGLSIAEIAERMGRSYAATAGVLKRGMAKLRRELVAKESAPINCASGD